MKAPGTMASRADPWGISGGPCGATGSGSVGSSGRMLGTVGVHGAEGEPVLGFGVTGSHGCGEGETLPGSS